MNLNTGVDLLQSLNKYLRCAQLVTDESSQSKKSILDFDKYIWLETRLAACQYIKIAEFEFVNKRL